MLHMLALLAAALMTPDEALKKLMDGNSHFVNNTNTHRTLMEECKDTHLEGQTPFAAIVGCSDSRAPPEILFDTGIGELFIVRDAGNVIGPIELDSVGYAVTVLKAPLIVVLGHQNCGAVKAALQGKQASDVIPAIYPLIKGALKTCQKKGVDPLKEATECNVRKGVEMLKKAPHLAPLIAQKKLQVVGAYYEIATGKVSFLPN
ncbi:MAG: carbonic anhydrase [Verrucomicrobia bacterium]|nr:carbonic anhydrase [Verrucomicrobiota bacterium]